MTRKRVPAKTKKTRRNPDDLLVAAEAARGIGSAASAPARKVLEVVATAFSGGLAFTPLELANEARVSETTVRRALGELRRLGYVHTIGRELNRMGKKGPERFVGTLSGEDRSRSDQDLRATSEGERLLEKQIAQEEALASFLETPRAKPGKGKTYRPTIHRQKTGGHKLPPRTAARIRRAGYRVCNPTDAEAAALARALRVSGGDVRQALRFLEGATDAASRSARNKLIRLSNTKDTSMRKKTKKTTKARSKKASSRKPARAAKKKKARKKTTTTSTSTTTTTKKTKHCSNAKRPARPKKSSRAYRAGKALRRAGSSVAHAAKRFYAGLVSKENPLSPQDVALHLIAQRGKAGAARLARTQEKHARSHGQKAEAKRWRAIRIGVARVRLGAAPKSARKNPLSGVVAAAVANPVSRLPLGKVLTWKDAPPAMKKDPLARKAVLLASRRLGIPMDEVPGEVCEGPAGTPRHVASSGELVSFSYKTPLGSKDSHTRSGRRIVYDHAAGDHGRGKKKTRPALLTNDPRTGLPILVSRRGSRPGFSSRRGQTG